MTNKYRLLLTLGMHPDLPITPGHVKRREKLSTSKGIKGIVNTRQRVHVLLRDVTELSIVYTKPHTAILLFN
jgi:hypothetical protein